jgi:hypothetical protein
MTPHMKLKWAQAEVSGGKLTVELSDKPGRDWKRSFQNTVKLLGAGDWGAVKLNGKKLTVAEVTAGDEAKLHHYLEGLVEQADAAVAAQQESDAQEEREGAAEGPDADMQQRFREFAPDEESDAEPEGD